MNKMITFTQGKFSKGKIGIEIAKEQYSNKSTD